MDSWQRVCSCLLRWATLDLEWEEKRVERAIQTCLEVFRPYIVDKTPLVRVALIQLRMNWSLFVQRVKVGLRASIESSKEVEIY